MKRTLNNTNRRKITQEHYSVSPASAGDFTNLIIEWDLLDLTLSGTDALTMEFATTGGRKRIDLGEVGTGKGKITIPNPFIPAVVIQATLRASADVEDGPRLWTAVSKGKSVILAIQENEDSSILPIVPVPNLTRLWALNFSGNPVLEVCNSQEIYANLKGNPAFFASLVPAIVQELAQRYLLGIGESRNWDNWPTFFENFGLNAEELDRFDALDIDTRLNEIMDKSRAIAEEYSAQMSIVSRVVAQLRELEND